MPSRFGQAETLLASPTRLKTTGGGVIVPLRASEGKRPWPYDPHQGTNLSPHRVNTTHREPRVSGQQASVHQSPSMISSAQRTASAIALTVAGTLFPPSRASLRAARILAAIRSTRFRPSSTMAVYYFRLLFATKIERGGRFLPYRPPPFLRGIGGQIGSNWGDRPTGK